MLDHLKLALSIIIEIIAVVLIIKLFNKKQKLLIPVSKVYFVKVCLIFLINTIYIFIKYYELNIDFRYGSSPVENISHIIFFIFNLLLWFNTFLTFKLFKYFFKNVRPIISVKWSLSILLLLILSFWTILFSDNKYLIKLSFYFQILSVSILVLLEPIFSLIVLIFKKRISRDTVKSKLFFSIHLWKIMVYLIFTTLIIISSFTSLIKLSELFSYSLLILIYLIPDYVLGRDFLKNKYNSTQDKWNELKFRYDLTPREIEISELITRGKSNKEIEQLLFISQSTVKNHLSNIYRKFKINSRLELSTLINKDLN